MLRSVQAIAEANIPLPTTRAGFWRRFGAAFVDGVLLAVVNVILGFLLHKIAYGVDWVVSAAYFTWFHGRTGQTPGDAALGLRVLDRRAANAQPIGYARAFGRWVVSIVSAAAVLLGYLWMIWDGEKQTWHDKAVGSVVVPADDL
jgi:uncharacterized RDD family membrane protein YckC